jgi:hypothetical protein
LLLNDCHFIRIWLFIINDSLFINTLLRWKLLIDLLVLHFVGDWHHMGFVKAWLRIWITHKLAMYDFLGFTHRVVFPFQCAERSKDLVVNILNQHYFLKRIKTVTRSLN